MGVQELSHDPAAFCLGEILTSIELLAGPVTGRRQVLGVLEVERVCFLHSLPWGRRGVGGGESLLCDGIARV